GGGRSTSRNHEQRLTGRGTRMAHTHAHGGAETGHQLGLSVALTLIFVVGEAAAGYLSHSLALVSDAGHNLADALALIFSWYAIRIARRPACAVRTYGSP